MTAKDTAIIAKATTLAIAMLSFLGFSHDASAQNPGRKFDGKTAKIVGSKNKKREKKFSDSEKEAVLYMQKDKAFKNLVIGVQKNQLRDFKNAEKYLLFCLSESSKPPLRKEWVPFREKTIKRALQELKAIQSLYRSHGMFKKSNHLYKNVLIPWNTKIYGNKSVELRTLRSQNQLKVIRPSGAQFDMYKSKENQYRQKFIRKQKLLKEAYAKIEADYKKLAPKTKTKSKGKAGVASSKTSAKKKPATTSKVVPKNTPAKVVPKKTAAKTK